MRKINIHNMRMQNIHESGISVIIQQLEDLHDEYKDFKRQMDEALVVLMEKEKQLLGSIDDFKNEIFVNHE